MCEKNGKWATLSLSLPSLLLELVIVCQRSPDVHVHFILPCKKHTLHFASCTDDFASCEWLQRLEKGKLFCLFIPQVCGSSGTYGARWTRRLIDLYAFSRLHLKCSHHLSFVLVLTLVLARLLSCSANPGPYCSLLWSAHLDKSHTHTPWTGKQKLLMANSGFFALDPWLQSAPTLSN